MRRDDDERTGTAQSANGSDLANLNHLERQQNEELHVDSVCTLPWVGADPLYVSLPALINIVANETFTNGRSSFVRQLVPLAFGEWARL